MTREEKIREAGELHLELQEKKCEQRILQAQADQVVEALGEIIKHHEKKDHGEELFQALKRVPSGENVIHDLFIKLGTVKARIAEIKQKLQI